MGIMRSIIKWCDKKEAEAYEETNERKAYGKAFAGGFVEGFCDAAVVLYVPMLIACYVCQANATDK